MQRARVESAIQRQARHRGLRPNQWFAFRHAPQPGSPAPARRRGMPLNSAARRHGSPGRDGRLGEARAPVPTAWQRDPGPRDPGIRRDDGRGAGPGSRMVATAVDLRSSFSNPRKPLGSLISRVLRGSRARRPRTRGAQIADERGPVRENSRQSQTRLSVSNRAELIAGYADGVPVRELATRFNVHRGTVREIARQAGLAARRPELPDATRQDAAQLYAGGLTLAQVAARLAVSTEAVRSAVIASGGTIRAGGRRRVGA